MSHIAGQGQHRSNSTRTNRAALIIVFVIVLAVALGIGAWFATHRTDGNGPAHAGVSDVALNKAKNTPKPVTEHHGNSPDCPDTDCIAMLVNGDLLFHEGLWSHFQGPNPNATDGTAFNFDPLFAPMKQYIQASDIAVCEFETPIAQRGGPYAAYPIFNIPPEVADAARNVGYNACTHATNHSWDQGGRMASPVCGARLRPMASPRPARTKPKPTPPNRWSSIPRPAAASWVWSPARSPSTA